MKKFVLFAASAIALLAACNSSDDSWLTGIAPEPVEEPVTRAVPIELSESEQQVGDRLHQFSWKLFGQFYKWRQEWHAADPNTLVSPFSMVSNLSVLMNGMEGEAQRQLLKVMGLEGYSIDDVNAFYKAMGMGIDKADAKVRFYHENIFRYDKGLKLAGAFSKSLKELGVRTEATDVENALDYQSVNKVSFLGNWEREFSADKTEKAVFHKADGTEKEVDMMFQELVTYYLEHETFTATRVKLNTGAYDVFFILPKEGVKVEDVLASIEPIDLKYGDGAQVSFWLPKFKVSDKGTLDTFFLQEIGFEPAYADGLEFFENHDTELSAIVQDTSFSIDEKGVEGGAVTEWDTAYHACNPEIKIVDFRLDRPFIYGIVETSTNTPLFIGYYGN